MAVRVRVPLAAPFYLIMKKFAYLIFLLVTIILTSCGVSSGRFKLEGKLLHMNQGEFYVYSPDGGFDGVDTIKVEGGRFTFETACKDNFTILVVFPNFSEQPIFAESGKSVEIKGDASHLKEMTVKGTKANELMTSFRKDIATATPPEEKKQAEQFIRNHPESVVSVFLVRKYFITSLQPDLKKAYTLIQLMEKEQPKNGQLAKMQKLVKQLKDSEVGDKLPAFTAYDTNGRLVSFTELMSAPVTVITTWASYNYDSQSLQRDLKMRQRNSKGKLKLLSLCLDASKKDCKDALQRDSISWPTICNGDMLEDKTLQTLGLTAVPDNIILQNGKIIARGLKKQELNAKLDQLLK